MGEFKERLINGSRFLLDSRFQPWLHVPLLMDSLECSTLPSFTLLNHIISCLLDNLTGSVSFTLTDKLKPSESVLFTKTHTPFYTFRSNS